VTAFEQLTIETPEQIALEFPLAGVGSRFLALAVDLLIQFALIAGLVLLGLGVAWSTGAGSPFTSAEGNSRIALWTFALVLLAGFVVFYGYFAIFEIAWRGQTPGKRLIGLRVIAASGRPASAYQILLRNLLRIVDQLPGPYAFGILSVLVTARSQRLGDLAAGTVVVHERTPRETHAVREDLAGLRASALAGAGGAAAGGTAGGGAGAGAGAAGTGQATSDRLRASRLTAQELALIERFLQRRGDLQWQVREQTAASIAARVRERLQLPPGGPDEELLERVAADYRTFGVYR
jgi:uncharacterized RDD family membrane protein YckC